MGFFNNTTAGATLKIIQEEGLFDVYLHSIKNCTNKNVKGEEVDAVRFSFYRIVPDATESSFSKEWTFLTMTASLDPRATLKKNLDSFVALSAQEKFYKELESEDLTPEEAVLKLTFLKGKIFTVKIEASVSEKTGKTYYNVKRIEIKEKADPYAQVQAVSAPKTTPLDLQAQLAQQGQGQVTSYAEFKAKEEASKKPVFEDDDIPF